MIINTRPEKLSRDLNYLAKSIDIELTNIPLTEVKIKDFLTQDEIELLKKISTFEGIVFTILWKSMTCDHQFMPLGQLLRKN
jgi:hypothetical protein